MNNLNKTLVDHFAASDPPAFRWFPYGRGALGVHEHAWVLHLEEVSVCPVVGLGAWVAAATGTLEHLFLLESGPAVCGNRPVTLTLEFADDRELHDPLRWSRQIAYRLVRENGVELEGALVMAVPDLQLRADYSRERVAA
jgi:hypothetical protein